jgi:hypothetical protein
MASIGRLLWVGAVGAVERHTSRKVWLTDPIRAGMPRRRLFGCTRARCRSERLI